ncbi:MAG: hypothetical protein IT160_03295 [Bryobacterales bacterium]|nr:hypothetical protein [Bryobacterales bacterium]
MHGYLENYGAGEERRAKLIRRWSFIVLAILVAAGVTYFSLRDRTEKAQIARFLDLLRQKNYRGAYALWGCTEAHPCRDYSFARFLEDWGPDGPHKDYSEARLSRSRSCDAGIIATINFGRGEPVLLWVTRSDKSLSFAPWPVCTPKMAPQYAP